MREIDISWAEIVEASERLATLVARRNVRYDAILAISRGGLFPSGVLSYTLGIKDVAAVAVERYERRAPAAVHVIRQPDWGSFEGKSVLIVDEMVDEGVTIDRVRRCLPDAAARRSTAVLYCMNGAPAPDYFVHAVPAGVWLNFPWGE